MRFVVACLILAAPAWAQRAEAPRPDSAQGRTVRLRLVGVFDENTGEPVEGTEVRDYSSGLSAVTTATGTLVLPMLDTTGALLGVKKVGYLPQTLLIGTTTTDTVPLTVTMRKVGQALPAVITTASGRTVRLGPADTIRALFTNGFYERRASSAAPSSAFITGDKLRSTMLVSNARFFGRALCEGNLFIDGAKIGVDARTGMFMKEGVDMFVSPSDVAGIETYYFGEMPASAPHTLDGPGAFSADNAIGSMPGRGCVSMIWLRR